MALSQRQFNKSAKHSNRPGNCAYATIDKCRMPNAEARMTKEARMANSEIGVTGLPGGVSSFEIRHSFVIRASALGIPVVRRPASHRRHPPRAFCGIRG